MNEKEQQLSFEKGITNVPSDALCSDNALEELVGMISDNGEHRVIQNPSTFINRYSGCSEMPVLLYVHVTTKDVYIGYFKSNNKIAFGEKSGTTYSHLGVLENILYTSDTKITSIGRTLVISDANGLHYFLWKNGSYRDLGQIPQQKIEFSLHDGGLSQYVVRNNASVEGIEFEDNYVSIKSIENWNNLIIGLYSKNKKAIASRKGFCLPFLARTALRLYDGSYINISQPVMLFPSIMQNTLIAYIMNDQIQLETYYYSFRYANKSYTDNPTGGYTSLYEEWTDIVKDIVIFITDGIEINDLTVDQPIGPFNFHEGPTANFVDGVFYSAGSGGMRYQKKAHNGWRALSGFDSTETGNEMTSRSVFYKLCTVGLFEMGPLEQFVESKVTKHYLENLTTQEQLKYDDYFSHSNYYPQTIYAYNSRLNMANVRRSLFEGYDYFMPLYVPNGHEGHNEKVRYYVTIQTEDGERVAMHEASSNDQQNIYFYYPDARAKHVMIFRQNINTQRYDCLLDKDLKEHGSLNGAFFFDGVPTQEKREEYNSKEEPTNYDSSPETLANYIITSEVNNPWVFKAEGHNKVGTGKIMGLSTTTQALSQGQFGQFPLLVFSESGIWAMELNSTGLFVSIHPMSREVCNNEKSITQTDGAVFFSSEKGLMVVDGNDVKCVSSQLSGREASFTGEISMGNFHDYMYNSIIAYDYRDSLLWIINSQRSSNTDYCYIYSIKNGTFGKFHFGGYVISNVINKYPDFLVQDNNGNIHTLTGRPNINIDSNTYGGKIITRPMKFENALALKSLLQIRHITNMQGVLKLRIFASNNLNKWVELHSLGGMPWKYYRFAYSFENMMATDRFAGSVVITQERRTDKLR